MKSKLMNRLKAVNFMTKFAVLGSVVPKVNSAIDRIVTFSNAAEGVKSNGTTDIELAIDKK